MFIFLLKCNFTDDTTTYICDENLENVLKSLEKISILAICWFENNYIILNSNKGHLTVRGYRHDQVLANMGKGLICKCNYVKLLGISID